jgi:putative endonuclease
VDKRFWVYMLASQHNGTLYIGSTSDLIRRVHEHRSGAMDGFTKQYAVHLLVWFEEHTTPVAMVTRERQLKKWNREWKIRLIERANPDWRDLFDSIT